MGRCVIFCAGGFAGLAAPIANDDYIIAADGGYIHTQKLGLAPDAVLGDFDSLGYIPENANVFPVEKDDTDTILAVRHGLRLGFREFMIYGAMDGPRADHAIANFQTLQYLADRGAVGFLPGLTQQATVLKNGSLVFPEACRGTLSVFCLGPDAEGVTLRGLKYNLENATLSCGFPLGVSNQFTGCPASVCVKNGSLLLLWDSPNPLPEICYAT